jgi:hypothetical protein
MATPVPVPPQPPANQAPLADTGVEHSQAWAQYHQSMSDWLAGAQLKKGVTDGSDAKPGELGEYMTSTGANLALTTNVTATLASLNLTAGDWDVHGFVAYSVASGAHPVSFLFGVASLDTNIVATFPSGPFSLSQWTGPKRVNVSAAGVAHVLASCIFTGSVSAQGSIMARRVR